MDITYINKVLKEEGAIFIEDSIEEVVIRLSLKNDKLSVYGKRHGKKEVKTRTDVDVVYNALLEGEQITEARYYEY